MLFSTLLTMLLYFGDGLMPLKQDQLLLKNTPLAELLKNELGVAYVDFNLFDEMAGMALVLAAVVPPLLPLLELHQPLAAVAAVVAESQHQLLMSDHVVQHLVEFFPPFKMEQLLLELVNLMDGLKSHLLSLVMLVPNI